MYSCPLSSAFTQYLSNATVCNLGNGCSEVIYVWAPGQDVFDLPDEVSFGMGTSDGAMYATIQVHYTNPNGVSGELDSSGIRVYYDTVPTTHLAGVLQLGDAFIRASPLPANTASVHLELSCPSQCTNLLTQSVNIFGSFLHMHGHGTMIYSTITSGTTGVTSSVNRVEFYDYGFQQISPVNVQLNAGDRLNTHCIYSTSGDTTAVDFGLATTQEMCIEFSYYPKVSATACTLIFNDGFNTTYCGEGNVVSSVSNLRRRILHIS